MPDPFALLAAIRHRIAVTREEVDRLRADTARLRADNKRWRRELAAATAEQDRLRLELQAIAISEALSATPPMHPTGRDDEMPRVCCDLHGRHCEQPSELCCQRCTEWEHPRHPYGVPCTWLLGDEMPRGAS